MLDELAIENVAIIDQLLLRFSPGFTVLTGETGAGKSIIIDALQAALGARVGADYIRSGARFAAVEAIFSGDALSDTALAETLREAGIEPDDSLILRREIHPSGRSTARINGRAVPLAVLQQVGSSLVDIHGQSDHLSILRRDRQLEVLDRFGNLGELRDRVSAAVRQYQALRRELEDTTSGQSEAERRLDLLRFQAEEIEAADPKPGEVEALEEERNLLANAEKLSQLAGAAYLGLQGEGRGATEAVTEAVTASRELAA